MVFLICFLVFKCWCYVKTNKEQDIKKTVKFIFDYEWLTDVNSSGYTLTDVNFGAKIWKIQTKIYIWLLDTTCTFTLINFASDVTLHLVFYNT